jgi:gliding motility-associated-like protein
MRANATRLFFIFGYFYLMGASFLGATPVVIDDPCNATPLTVTETCTYATYNNNTATGSAGVPAPGCGNYVGADVWFSIVMPNNGYHVQVDLQAGTLNDMAMAVYDGLDCNNLSLVSCAASNGADNMPVLIIDDGCMFAGANATFWIRVWDEGGNQTGNFDICVQAITPPVPGAVTGCGSDPITGDICCDAILLTDNMNGYCGNTGGFTGSDDSIADFCFFLENDSWLAFVAESSSVEIGIVHSNCITGNGIQAIIYETSDCTNFTMVSTNCLNPGPTGSASGTLQANGLTPGQTYYLMIDGWNGDICDYTLSIISGVLTSSATAADATICAGQSTTLSANVYGVGPYTYAWTPTSSLDDPTSATPIATPGISTNYTVVITSPSGSITESVVVTVAQGMPGTSSINGPNKVCQNTSGVLYDAVSSNATTYSWTVTGGTISGSSTGSTLLVNWATASGTVCMTPSNDCGTAAQVCLNVTVIPPPNITATNPPRGCAPGCVNLVAAGISNTGGGGVGPISHYQNFSDANNGVNPLPSPIVCTAGTYWVRMDTGFNCYDVTSIIVTIENPSIVVVDPQPVCSPNTINLDTGVFKNEVNGWPGGSYTYYSTSANATNETNPLPSPVVSTSGTYWVRYETAAGCFDVEDVLVTIQQAPDLSLASPLYTCDCVDLTTAAVTDANSAPVTSVSYFLSSAFAGLGWPALAMPSTNVCASGTYYGRYQTAAGCWDTIHIQVIKTAIPTATLSGGATVCAGVQGTLNFTMTGTPPFDVVYSNGATNITLNNISSPYSELVTINSNTTFTLVSVSDAGGCAGTMSGSASFTVTATPTFSISGGTTVCNGEVATLTFNLTGAGPFNVVYNNGTNVTLNGISNGHTINVTPTANTTFTPVSVSNSSGCAGTVGSGATVNLYPAVQVVNLQETCEGTNTMYTVTFQLTGGDPSSYQVTGGGSFNFGNNTFTSNPITSGNTYQFMVSDDTCGPDPVNGVHACDCTTYAGTMSTVQKLVCETATVTMNFNNNAILDANDVRYFVLHDSPGPGLGNILMTNINPQFAYNPTLNFEQVYYVSSVAGNNNGGIPNINDPCLDISNSQSVTFFEETEATFSAPAVICEGETAQLTVNLTGSSTYNIKYTDGTNIFTVNSISDGHTINVSPTTATTYTITQVNNSGVPFCTGTASASGAVTINLSQQPTISNLIMDCDNQNLNYTVSFDISGGVPSGYFVTGNSGTLVGNTFTSNPIPEGTPYSFTIGDGVCPSFVETGVQNCDCTTSIGNMLTTALLLCDDQTANAAYNGGEVLDDDDAFGFILHDSAGSPLGNILDSNTVPVFSFVPTMSYGVTYYITAVVGNDDGSGFPVLDQSMDGCLAFSESQPVTFFTGAELSINGDASICKGESANITFTFSTPGTFDVEYTDGTSNYTLTDIADGYVLEVTPDQTTSYTLISVANHAAPFCPGELVAGSSMVTVDVTEGPSIGNILFECDEESINYTLTFDVTGGNAANYAVVGLNGIWNGNTFVSEPMLGGTNFAFEVNDGGPCPAQEAGTYTCLCLPDMAVEMTIEQVIGCGGQADGVVSATNVSGTAPFTFSWSNGISGESVAQLAVGWHVVTMTDTYGCMAVDSVYLDEPTPISADLSATDPLCFGDSEGTISVNNLNGGTGVFEVSLNVLASFQNNVFTGLEAGNYVVEVEDNRGCTWSDSISINNPTQFMANTNEDVTIRLGDSISLEVYANAPLDSFYWSPQLPGYCDNCLTQYVYPLQAMTFHLTAISVDGCVSSDQMLVIVTKNNPIYIPNAFSPNGDGINDLLTLYPSISVAQIKTFKIYTRWGALLYQEENFMPGLNNQGWDGYFKGRLLNSGVYVYYAEIEFVDGSTEMVRGDFTLIR